MKRNIIKLLCLLLTLFCTICIGYIVSNFLDNYASTINGMHPAPSIRSRRVNKVLEPTISAVVSTATDTTSRDTQDVRKALATKYCERTGRNTMPNVQHIAVIPSLKILYCIMPKVASRQWREKLYIFKQGRGAPLLSRFPQEEQTKMLNTFFKFTFVREPFERLLSSYKDKFVYLRRMDRHILKLHGEAILKHFRTNLTTRALEKLDDITFSEFVQYLVTMGSNDSTDVMDWHWDNYENICGMCAINYDFIGHYETLEQDSLDFKVAAGIPANISEVFDFLVSNVSTTSSSLLDYYSHIPVKWIKILGEIYKSNFEMFGYDFPGPLKSLFNSGNEER